MSTRKTQNHRHSRSFFDIYQYFRLLEGNFHGIFLFDRDLPSGPMPTMSIQDIISEINWLCQLWIGTERLADDVREDRRPLPLNRLFELVIGAGPQKDQGERDV